MPISQRLYDDLVFLYGPATGAETYNHLMTRLDDFRRLAPDEPAPREALFDQRDRVLITYGDMVTTGEEPPLRTLRRFITSHLGGLINTVHILPFYPYSSDDGFSVIDYYAVNPSLGDWKDIAHYQADGLRLMVDLVLNHVSAESRWFQKFLEADPHYEKYFITADPSQDLSAVARPRALPLLTPFSTRAGERYVWTTFSADQIDLNFANPDTLLDIIDVFLFYLAHSASVIRLDAIAYLWKEAGTSCIHLPQTHAVIRILRAILEEAAPDALLITETNVPHEENISYFGSGTDEAHLVYQFALPPLLAHALLTGSARHLQGWAQTLRVPSGQTTFFNFTASHDGVGVRPVLGILSQADIDLLVQTTLAHGGRISTRSNADGSTSPYELNITYFDLLNSPSAGEPLEMQARRFLVSQAVMLALAGVPGIYFHSLPGSRNYLEGVEQTGSARSINRHKLRIAEIEAELRNPRTLEHQVFTGYQRLLRARGAEPAFHPNAAQHILTGNDAIFAVQRTSPDGRSTVIALHNFQNSPQPCNVELAGPAQFEDLLTGRKFVSSAGLLSIELEPYAIMWLRRI